MSRVILGWQLDRPMEEPDVAALVARIKARYQPLFTDPIQQTGIWHENQALLQFDVTRRDDSGLYQDGARIICLNGSPSTTADSVAGGARLFGAKDLYDLVHDSSGRVDRHSLHRINPPFTLCWFDKPSRELGLAHDGLGADQFFVAETSRGMVFSNKCWPILHLLGETPRVDHAAWRYWFCLGWFPGSSTPFENVRHLDRGEIIRADSRTIRYELEDTFPSWVHPEEGAPPEARMARAGTSIEQLIRLNRPAEARYQSDLTGGLDSRAICSFLIKDGIPCTYYTGGPRHSSDVAVARRIAGRFHLEWVHVEDPRFERHAGLPEVVDLQFAKMLLWGEGLVEPLRFKHFQVEPHPTTQGSYLSGGSSEISRCPYYGRFMSKNDDPALEYRRHLARLERRITTAPLSDADASEGTRLIREQAGRGAAYGLEALALLDFMYLSEKIRRWQHAHRAINLFDRSVVPFLNIEHIELAFAMRPRDKAKSRFQKFVIAQNAAELLRMPFGSSRRYQMQDRMLAWMSRTSRLAGALGTQSWAGYLRSEGKSRIDSILASDTPLWQVLDRERTRAQWDTFLQGSEQRIQFPLGLMAFQHWYALYFDSALG